ncbi:autophagy protein 16 [Umbelopsis sp. PMI_123]|nr:autophagy protein 16 [Umbelopsis sp. PMI_123]
MSTAALSYEQLLLQRLEERNSREHAYTTFVHSNKQLYDSLKSLRNQVAELQTAKEHLTSRNSLLEEERNSLSQHGSPDMQQRTLQLKEEVQRLKAEQTEMYKIQGQNAQRLVDMNDKLRAYEESDKESKAKQEEMEANIIRTVAKLEQQTHLLKEKDVAIQVLQDELSTLQLEFSTTEEKNKRLEKENADLVQRWLKKMNEEAEKMNEATMFYESIVEQAKIAENNKSAKRWTFRSKSGDNDLEKLKNIQDVPLRISMVSLPSEPFQTQSITEGEIHCINCSPAGNMYAIGGSDKKVRVYNSRQYNLTHTLSGSLQTLTSVDFNETEEFILGSCMDNSTRIWDLASSRIRHTLTGHIGKVCSAEFTADSNRVVSGSQDRTLKVWDLHKGYCTRTIFTFSSCNDVCLIDREGSTIASGHLDNNVRLWDTRTGNGIKELTGLHTGQVTSVSVSPDGSKLLTNSRDNTLHFVDLRMYRIIRTFQDESYRNGLNWSRACFSPDGHYAAAGSASGSIHFWNTMTGKHESSVPGHKQPICAVAWNPLGTQLFSADRHKTYCVWDTSSQL